MAWLRRHARGKAPQADTRARREDPITQPPAEPDDELRRDDALDLEALLRRRDALRAGAADIDQLRAEVARLEETARLYAEQLQRVGDLEEVALRHELALQAVRNPETGSDGETTGFPLAPVVTDGADQRRAALPPARELVREARLLERKGRQYDRLLEEVKELRPKARRNDRVVDEVPELRDKAAAYDELLTEVEELRLRLRREEQRPQPRRGASPALQQVEPERADLPALRYKARRHDELVAEVEALRAKAARYDALVGESQKLLPGAAAKDPLFVVRAYGPLLNEVKGLRFKAQAHDRLLEEVKLLRLKVRQLEAREASPRAPDASGPEWLRRARRASSGFGAKSRRRQRGG